MCFYLVQLSVLFFALSHLALIVESPSIRDFFAIFSELDKRQEMPHLCLYFSLLLLFHILILLAWCSTTCNGRVLNNVLFHSSLSSSVAYSYCSVRIYIYMNVMLWCVRARHKIRFIGNTCVSSIVSTHKSGHSHSHANKLQCMIEHTTKWKKRRRRKKTHKGTDVKPIAQPKSNKKKKRKCTRIPFISAYARLHILAIPIHMIFFRFFIFDCYCCCCYRWCCFRCLFVSMSLDFFPLHFFVCLFPALSLFSTSFVFCSMLSAYV